MNTLVPLTSFLHVNQGSHILYFYHSIEGYIENAISYITSGLELGHHINFIDSRERWQLVTDRLGSVDHSRIHYIDNYEFYEMYQDFHFNRILLNFHKVIDPFLQQELTVRIWGHVDWMEQEDIMSKLHKYECSCDITISDVGYTTVCAYNSNSVPATILIEMSKCHEYVMTDDQLVQSSLYKSSDQHPPISFPSLSIQKTIDSEMDLYKQKLDFVHVVSHEVRNPLTVIKAYASMLREEEQDEQRRQKLEAIKNYAVVIDNEISHIIHTEQMLSTDALWQKKRILAGPATNDVIDIMNIKAQTQNITLRTDIQLTGNETLSSNLMGYKMIVSNLLSNAIKYSYEGETVAVEVRAEAGSLVIEISDTGVGMSEEQIAKLYHKYEKINQEQSGQGIGLFMVKQLVDHFEGTIDVHSKLGLGTTFRVCLPLYQQN
ncbi:MEDS domain-containing protein [Brevibacillus migulae]|uniref:MEDS domain-containing protein n=1 Tax=Brevibacillus migulae TaxID=1644114 RepID=UPI00106E81D6|nr:ATP-binding protein [Brevibacillus migulae]